MLGHLGTPSFRGAVLTPSHVAHHTSRQSMRVNPDVAQHFFNNKQYVVFQTSGVARWMLSLPAVANQACCDLDWLGVDGTTGGISMSSCLNIRSVWMPPEGERKPTVNWGAIDRCCLPVSITSRKHTTKIRNNRKIIHEMTNTSTHLTKAVLLFEQIKPQFLPAAVLREVERWSRLGSARQVIEREALRSILFCVSSKECVLQIIEPCQFELYTEVLDEQLNKDTEDEEKREQWDERASSLICSGMGPEFVAVINEQMARFGSATETFLELFEHLRELCVSCCYFFLTF